MCVHWYPMFDSLRSISKFPGHVTLPFSSPCRSRSRPCSAAPRTSSPSSNPIHPTRPWPVHWGGSSTKIMIIGLV